jgi:hypothetical protein
LSNRSFFPKARGCDIDIYIVAPDTPKASSNHRGWVDERKDEVVSGYTVVKPTAPLHCTLYSTIKATWRAEGSRKSSFSSEHQWTLDTANLANEDRTMVRGSQRLRHSIAKVATGEEIPVMTAFLRDVALSAF